MVVSVTGGAATVVGTVAVSVTVEYWTSVDTTVVGTVAVEMAVVVAVSVQVTVLTAGGGHEAVCVSVAVEYTVVVTAGGVLADTPPPRRATTGRRNAKAYILDLWV